MKEGGGKEGGRERFSLVSPCHSSIDRSACQVCTQAALERIRLRFALLRALLTSSPLSPAAALPHLRLRLPAKRRPAHSQLDTANDNGRCMQTRRDSEMAASACAVPRGFASFSLPYAHPAAPTGSVPLPALSRCCRRKAVRRSAPRRQPPPFNCTSRSSSDSMSVEDARHSVGARDEANEGGQRISTVPVLSLAFWLLRLPISPCASVGSGRVSVSPSSSCWA